MRKQGVLINKHQKKYTKEIQVAEIELNEENSIYDGQGLSEDDPEYETQKGYKENKIFPDNSEKIHKLLYRYSYGCGEIIYDLCEFITQLFYGIHFTKLIQENEHEKIQTIYGFAELIITHNEL